MHIIRSTKEKLVKEFVINLIKTINERITKEKFEKVAIFLSGGSLKSVYQDSNFQKFLLKYKERIELYLIDERYTAELKEDSLNDLGVRSTNIQNCVSKYVPIIDTSKLTKLKPVNSYVKNYSKILNKLLPDKKISKIGLMGVGNDFHTAGIFPCERKMGNLKFNNKDLVTYHQFGKEPFNKRITITLTGLKYIDEFFIFLKSEEKKCVCEYLTQKLLSPLNERPCGIYKSLNTTIITDLSS